MGEGEETVGSGGKEGAETVEVRRLEREEAGGVEGKGAPCPPATAFPAVGVRGRVKFKTTL